MDLQEHLEAYCREHALISPEETIVVGVSGGADSVCLLALLKTMAPAWNLRLHVAHLNHALRGQAADEDAAFVAQLAEQWQLPVTIQKVDVAAIAAQKRQNLEEAAREARYAFLAQTAVQIGARKVAVAHNLNDQAETVLMRVIRGAGTAGLRGILPAAPFAPPPVTIIRPLLNTPRTEIDAFCAQNNLSPREDATNQNSALLRNKLRHEILPALAQCNPNIVPSLGRLASLMAADYKILQKELERAWRFVVKSHTDQAVIIDRHDWQILPLAMQREVLRQAILRLRRTRRDVEFAHIEDVVSRLKAAGTGTIYPLPLNLKLTVGYDTFILADETWLPSQPDQPWLEAGATRPLKIPGVTRLSEGGWAVYTHLLIRSSVPDENLKQQWPWQAYFDAAKVGQAPVLRTRQPGDLFCPLGLNGHRQPLKEFMINRKIPAWQRPHIPLLVAENGQICWVCGYRTDQTTCVTDQTDRLLLVEFRTL